MTERQPAPAEVEILAPTGIRLVETAAPDLTPEERTAMDRAWAEAVRANPTFFDGPVAVCAGLRSDGPQDLELGWARTTYRQFVLRRVPGATGWLPALFVAVVQPADDGRVLVGRMAGPTAHPGRWGLPGGNVEPPTGDDLLDEPALQRHAPPLIRAGCGAAPLPPGPLPGVRRAPPPPHGRGPEPARPP
ncbi:hypothetical protein ACFV4F_34925, partial [Kitasatospora sp. NPDC059722]